jgi:hypothetical protein
MAHKNHNKLENLPSSRGIDDTQSPLFGRKISGRDLVGLYRGSDETGSPIGLILDGHTYLLSPLPLGHFCVSIAHKVEVGELREFQHGELRRELESVIRSNLQIRKGRSIANKEVNHMVNLLIKNGWNAKFESVRTKLRTMGYYEEQERR